MTKPLELEVGNFICRFGDKLVLNDLLEEVVLPAFFDEERRKYRSTEYMFIDQRFRYLQAKNLDSLALCCRMVKNTVLKRHQVFSEEHGIVPDKRSMASAPSSIAILLLRDHRLLFVREVPQAPTMNEFGTTFRYRMNNAVMAYRQSTFESRKDKRRVSLKSLKDEIPVPTIDIVPLFSSESLKAFIDRFDTLRDLQIKIAPTNSEIDNEEFFRTVREKSDDAGSKTTVIRHHNDQGLNKEGCFGQIDAAKHGNAVINMSGKDKNGDKLNGDSSHFSVKASLAVKEEAPISELENSAYLKYVDLKENQITTQGKMTYEHDQKLRDAFKRRAEGESNG